MTDPENQQGFKSWRQALEANILTPEQLEVLQDMVTKGDAKDLAAAAIMLDWQDGIIHKPEHLYGL
jgi:hypothetical protein